ncbi:hypothetical protein KTH_34810 [Thermosporothrix hazakensis]|uniref:Uncharacterized protein n=1 Tax=Thermosporothrix sp. COM3 TaxID=2490863 RepID=A0A455STY9_9CHLR|nr:hypothetical protein KTC_53100 [Thermosporothrix sp. COM3]GCE48612.1 hypothetical protein KTH_34810 [Thermosporothrix hazakensis]
MVLDRTFMPSGKKAYLEWQQNYVWHCSRRSDARSVDHMEPMQGYDGLSVAQN